jgi:hypothetical protein
MHSCCPFFELASVFPPKEAANRRLHCSRPELFEPVGRDQALADIRGGQYFGEIAFTVMVKKMLQVPREVMLRSSNTSMWLNLLVFLTSEEICRTQMMAGSLRSRWQFSKSAHSTISCLEKVEETNNVRYRWNEIFSRRSALRMSRPLLHAAPSHLRPGTWLTFSR